MSQQSDVYLLRLFTKPGEDVLEVGVPEAWSGLNVVV
jgi:hypothetical protein